MSHHKERNGDSVDPSWPGRNIEWQYHNGMVNSHNEAHFWGHPSGHPDNSWMYSHPTSNFGRNTFHDSDRHFHVDRGRVEPLDRVPSKRQFSETDGPWSSKRSRPEKTHHYTNFNNQGFGFCQSEKNYEQERNGGDWHSKRYCPENNSKVNEVWSSNQNIHQKRSTDFQFNCQSPSRDRSKTPHTGRGRGSTHLSKSPTSASRNMSRSRDESNEINVWLQKSKDMQVMGSSVSRDVSKNPLPGSHEERSNAIKEATDRLKKTLLQKKQPINLSELLSSSDESKMGSHSISSQPKALQPNLSDLELDASDMKAIGRANPQLLSEALASQNDSDDDIVEIARPPSPPKLLIDLEESPMKDKSAENHGQSYPVSSSVHISVSPNSDASAINISTSHCPRRSPGSFMGNLSSSPQITSPHPQQKVISELQKMGRNKLKELINNPQSRKVECAIRELMKEHRALISKQLRREAESRISTAEHVEDFTPEENSNLLVDFAIDWDKLPGELITSLGDLFQNLGADGEEGISCSTSTTTEGSSTLPMNSSSQNVTIGDNCHILDKEEINIECVQNRSKLWLQNSDHKDYSTTSNAKLATSSQDAADKSSDCDLDKSCSKIKVCDFAKSSQPLPVAGLEQLCTQYKAVTSTLPQSFSHNSESFNSSAISKLSSLKPSEDNSAQAHSNIENTSSSTSRVEMTEMPSQSIQSNVSQDFTDNQISNYTSEKLIGPSSQDTSSSCSSESVLRAPCSAEGRYSNQANEANEFYSGIKEPPIRNKSDNNMLKEKNLKEREFDKQSKGGLQSRVEPQTKELTPMMISTIGGEGSVAGTSDIRKEPEMTSLNLHTNLIQDSTFCSDSELVENASTQKGNCVHPPECLMKACKVSVAQRVKQTCDKNLREKSKYRSGSEDQVSREARNSEYEKSRREDCNNMNTNGESLHVKHKANSSKVTQSTPSSLCTSNFVDTSSDDQSVCMLIGSPPRKEISEISNVLESTFQCSSATDSSSSQSSVANKKGQLHSNETVNHSQETNEPVTGNSDSVFSTMCGDNSYGTDEVSMLPLIMMTVPARSSFKSISSLSFQEMNSRIFQIDKDLQRLVEERICLTNALRKLHAEKQPNSTVTDSRNVSEPDKSISPNCDNIHSPAPRKSVAAEEAKEEEILSASSKTCTLSKTTSSPLPLQSKDLTSLPEPSTVGSSEKRKKKGKTKHTGKLVLENSKTQVCNNDPEIRDCFVLLEKLTSHSISKHKGSKSRQPHHSVQDSKASESKQLPQKSGQTLSGDLAPSASVNETYYILDLKMCGKFIFAASSSGYVFMYLYIDGISKLVKHFGSKAEGGVNCIAVEFVQPNESGAPVLICGTSNGWLRFHRLKNGPDNSKFQISGYIQCFEVRWGYVFCGTRSGSVVPFNLKKRLFEDTLSVSGSAVQCIKSHMEGARKVLIVASRNQPIEIRDAVSGLLLRTLKGLDCGTSVDCVTLSSDLIYCGTSSEDICGINFQSGALVRRLKAGKGTVFMKVFSGFLFASCRDCRLYIFDLKSGKSLWNFSGPDNIVHCFDTNKEMMICASKNKDLSSYSFPKGIQSALGNDVNGSESLSKIEEFIDRAFKKNVKDFKEHELKPSQKVI